MKYYIFLFSYFVSLCITELQIDLQIKNDFQKYRTIKELYKEYLNIYSIEIYRKILINFQQIKLEINSNKIKGKLYYLIGKLYYMSDNIISNDPNNKNEQEMIFLFNTALNYGEIKSYFYLSLIENKNVINKPYLNKSNSQIDILINGVKRNDLKCIISIGEKYNNGIYLKSNCTKAVQYYFLAAKKVLEKIIKQKKPIIKLDKPEINLNDIEIDENELIKNKIDDISFEYIKILADSGKTEAQYNLGKIYQYGLYNNTINKDLALKYYRKAANSQHLNASNAVIDLLMQKDNYENNYNYKKEILILLKSGLDMYDKNSYFIMGNIYFYGLFNFKKDIMKAIEYYEKADALGSVNASYQLGLIYYNGAEDENTKIQKDLDKTKIYWKKAADDKHILSSYNYSVLLLQENVNIDNNDDNENNINCSKIIKYLMNVILENPKNNEYHQRAIQALENKKYIIALNIYILLSELGDNVDNYILFIAKNYLTDLKILYRKDLIIHYGKKIIDSDVEIIKILGDIYSQEN